MNDVAKKINGDTKQKVFDWLLFKRLFKYTKGYRLSYLIAILFNIFDTLLSSYTPLINKDILDLLGENTINFNAVLFKILLYGVVILGSMLSYYIESMILRRVGNKIVYKIREDVFVSIEGLSIGQLNEIPVGKLVTRAGNDVNVLYELYTSILTNMLRNVFMLLEISIIMFFLNVKLALIVLISAPVVVIIAYIFRKYSRRAHREVRKGVSDINAFLSENISGMKVTQVFNQEDKKLKEFDEKNNKLRQAHIKEIIIFGVFRPLIYIIYIAIVVTVFWIGADIAMTSDIITYAVLFTFYEYISRFFGPLQNIADQFNRLQSAFSAAERIFVVLDSKSDIVEIDNPIKVDHLRGEIEFKDVWFAYVPDEWVLKGVSFKINAKETVAFVGTTGSGKTTILSLICRNYDIQKGEILIDGIDIKQYEIASLRRNIGQMLQDVFLFSGTILSNIQMRDEEITVDDVRSASEYVNADKFINKLPHLYDEEVKERGKNFSSGQKQLLSFARTIAHKPNIMILDEATANIDSETEILIQDSLTKMMNIGTMLIVAHRLSTVQHANKIIVLSHGEIVEQGTHQELLAMHGRYYKLYLLQYHHEQMKDE